MSPKAWKIMGVITLVLALITGGAGYSTFLGFQELVEELKSAPNAHNGTVTYRSGDDQTKAVIYAIDESGSTDDSFDTSTSRPRASCTATGPDGDVPVRLSAGSSKVSWGSTSWHSSGEFITQPNAEYRVTCDGAPAVVSKPIGWGIGQSIAGIFVALFAGFAGFVTTILTIVFFFRRRRV